MARTRRPLQPFDFAATLTQIDEYGRLCAYVALPDEKSAHVLKSRLPPADECRLPYHFKRRREQAETGAVLAVHFAWPRGADDKAVLQRHAAAFLGRRVSVRVQPRRYSYVRGDGVREQGIALTVLALTPLDEP